MNKRQREEARHLADVAQERIVRTAEVLRRREASKAARMLREGAGKRRSKPGTKRAGSAAYRPVSGPVIATGAYATIRNDAWERLCALLGDC